MTTKVQITKVGEDFMLPLTAEMLERLGVPNGGQVEITIENNAVVMRRAATEERRQTFRKLSAEVFEEYKAVFTALAEGAK